MKGKELVKLSSLLSTFLSDQNDEILRTDALPILEAIDDAIQESKD